MVATIEVQIKDEDDDWVIGGGVVAVLRGCKGGSIEQTNLLSAVTDCPEDVDGNGVVDIDDLLLLITNFGGHGEGDVDGDGVVGIDDLLQLIQVFGESCK